GKTDLRLTNLIEVDRQQLGRAGAVILVGLAEARRQQAHLERLPAMQRAVAHHRAASLEQAAEQAPGLQVRTVEGNLAATDRHHPRVAVAAWGPPGRGRGARRRRPAAQPAPGRLKTKSGLLAARADELSRAETGTRLHQRPPELIALAPPLHPL